MPRPRDTRSEDARALLAISELMQCKILSPATIDHLTQVREMLEARIHEAEQDSEEPLRA
jgi:hypothetical protein